MPAIDMFDRPADLQSPAYFAAAITPSDGSDLAFVTRGIFVGGAGSIAVITAGGSVVTFAGATAGTVIPIAVSRVKSTGTTATNLVAVW